MYKLIEKDLKKIIFTRFESNFYKILPIKKTNMVKGTLIIK